MIETLWTFGRRNVARNLSRILETSHPYLSGLIALLVAWDYAGFGYTIKLSNLANAFVAYDTVVFGFTATAIALAIAIPNAQFIEFLSSVKDNSTPFRTFLFVLAWNSVSHFAAFFLVIPISAIGDNWVLEPNTGLSLRTYAFFFFWVQLYACFQFLVTTLGLYELGDLYAQYVAKLKSASSPPAT